MSWKCHAECWFFYSQLTGQNGVHFSYLFLEKVQEERRRNSFGILQRGQKYNLTFVWWKCGKFQFPSVCAGGSRLNFESWFLGASTQRREQLVGVRCTGKSAGSICSKIQLGAPSRGSRVMDSSGERDAALVNLTCPKERKSLQLVNSFSMVGEGTTRLQGSRPLNLCQGCSLPFACQPTSVTSSVKWEHLEPCFKNHCEDSMRWWVDLCLLLVT